MGWRLLTKVIGTASSERSRFLETSSHEGRVLVDCRGHNLVDVIVACTVHQLSKLEVDEVCVGFAFARVLMNSQAYCCWVSLNLSVHLLETRIEARFRFAHHYHLLLAFFWSRLLFKQLLDDAFEFFDLVDCFLLEFLTTFAIALLEAASENPFEFSLALGLVMRCVVYTGPMRLDLAAVSSLHVHVLITVYVVHLLTPIRVRVLRLNAAPSIKKAFPRLRDPHTHRFFWRLVQRSVISLAMRNRLPRLLWVTQGFVHRKVILIFVVVHVLRIKFQTLLQLNYWACDLTLNHLAREKYEHGSDDKENAG